MPKLLTVTLLSLLLPTNCVGQVRPADTLCGLVEQRPLSITRLDDGAVLVDFGRVAYGNLVLSPPEAFNGALTVHLGEKSSSGRIDRKPPGTVRYHKVEVTPDGGGPVIVAPPADQRNTQQDKVEGSPAVLTPEAWGVVTPFRWVEIDHWPGELKPEQVVRRAAFIKGWSDNDASFECSDAMLNKIWELCRYSIKATTAFGVYIDGDRERIPYEGDAYINQLGHYYTDDDRQMARETFDWLERHPTWPTEWTQYMVLMAHADWMQTGDKQWLADRYDALQDDVLLQYAGPDGLLHKAGRIVVDWPEGERDGYVFTDVNTVVNALHLASLDRMAQIADALGKEGDAAEYREKFSEANAEFQRQLFNESTGLYVDGVGTDHSSLHANLFPLALGLVPDDKVEGVVDWLGSRGMDCSVYAAQLLLDGLLDNGAAEEALALMVAPGDRSWRHMVDSGTTITWEAWDQKYKPNQDWNHAWGAAPANLLPRHVLGAAPLEPGWRRAEISPKTGGLRFAKGKVPTPRGPITIDWTDGDAFRLTLSLPEGMPAKVDLPASIQSTGVSVNGKRVEAKRVGGNRWVLPHDITGTATIEVK